MVESVIWTQKASQRLDEMIAYLESEGALQAAANLIKRINRRLDVLVDYPEMGRPVKANSSIRYVRVDRYKIMFYRVQGSKLFISNFFDQRQDPSKRPF